MLTLALILDALAGERIWGHRHLQHPVVLIGRLIEWLERRLNRGGQRRAKGVLAVLVLLVVVVVLPVLLMLADTHWIVQGILGAIFLAHRSLVDHVGAVATGLRSSLADGRAAVSLIVGRDPQRLDEAGVARAAIESAAENFSDGVVAPAFWFAIAGLPGIVAYKVVNTADSMIGHKTERYLQFGWAAARLDDCLNWIPARLTGALFCVVGAGLSAFGTMRRDAPSHRSPNAGWPEAAMAACLDLALAGPRDYGSYQVDDPFMNPAGARGAGPDHIDLAVHLLWRAWMGVLVLAAFTALLT